jgi:hypothetical protein
VSTFQDSRTDQLETVRADKCAPSKENAKAIIYRIISVPSNRCPGMLFSKGDWTESVCERHCSEVRLEIPTSLRVDEQKEYPDGNAEGILVASQ